MQTLTLSGLKERREAFTQRIIEASGVDVSQCYQCGKCSAGCPVGFAMDLGPTRLMRLLQLGREEVLKSNTIWLCAQCMTCATRCPREVDISRVMESLRIEAKQRRIPCPESEVGVMDNVFLETVRRRGRLQELESIMRLKLGTGKLFKDIPLGIKLVMKGKIALLPRTQSCAREVRRLFRRVREKEVQEK